MGFLMFLSKFWKKKLTKKFSCGGGPPPINPSLVPLYEYNPKWAFDSDNDNDEITFIGGDSVYICDCANNILMKYLLRDRLKKLE